MGHDPHDITLRDAIRFTEHAEDIWEHRAAIITMAIGDAFGG